MKRVKTRSIIRTGLLVAFLTVCSFISVPSAIPFTLQTLAVFVAAGLLGPKRGSAAVLTYILLGAAGLPVFSGARGGMPLLFGATAGFIWGFLPMVYVCGKLIENKKRSPIWMTFAMTVGLLVCYFLGVAWYTLTFLNRWDIAGFGLALCQCVVPFIIPDILKILLATFIVMRLQKHFN